MSLLTKYGIKDLESVTVDLMNILYNKDWSEDVTAYDDEFVLRRINKLHGQIITDLNVENTPINNNSELFSIAHRLTLIDMALFGSSQHIPDAIGVKWCIEYTESIIKQLCIDQRNYCSIQ